ncbi:hypothetical protein BDP27DRAFT_1321096 [Rhodocollybia butyracea]|uniref:F-box domain-containing protein n=1 Tax=Rhodocollybia butyracea TaxID=206335 RepID=A0A9P5UBH5_9AGAR|nr:hypothetical protein BDP27DRAFT_1321096 [Rhodocollybia butyracea]
MSSFLSLSRIENPVWLSSRDRQFLLSRLDEKKLFAEKLSLMMEEDLDSNGDLDELTQQHNKELSEIASIRNILAPVRRLHPELLSQIFRQVGDSMDRTKASTKGPVHPVTMSHVCFVWRVTARSTCQLWTEYIHRSTRRKISISAAMIPNYLQCSGALPITTIDLDLESYSTDRISAFMEILIPFCPRIRLLCLRLPFEGIHCIDLPRRSFALLEELELITTVTRKQSKKGWKKSDGTFFRDCPRLRRFTAVGGLVYNWNPITTLPSDQILELDLSCTVSLPTGIIYVGLVLPLRFLKVFSNVVVLILSFQMFEPEPLELLALTSLALTTRDDSYSTFMDSLTAPNLISFKLSFMETRHGQSCSPFSPLLEFHRRCAAPIKELTLSRVVKILTNELTTLLALFPFLEKLELLNCPRVEGKSIFETLKFQGQRDVAILVPKLTRFVFCESRYFGDDKQEAYDVSFAEFVESRWWPDMQEYRGVSRLQKVHCAFPKWRVESGDFFTRLEACEGLELSFECK